MMNQETKTVDCTAEASTEGTNSQLPRVAPRQRVRETEDGWRIQVELPGVAPGDLQLEVEQRVLTLEGTPTEATLPEGSKVIRQEFQRTAFAQRWRLPARIDLDSIATTYRHGLLTIELPYLAPERRKIEVLTEK